jgi:hypothetical protein
MDDEMLSPHDRYEESATKTDLASTLLKKSPEGYPTLNEMVFQKLGFLNETALDFIAGDLLNEGLD